LILSASINTGNSPSHIIRNEKVGGSIPLSGTKKIKDLAQPHPLGFVAFAPDVRADVRRFVSNGRVTCPTAARAAGETHSKFRFMKSPVRRPS